MRLTRSTPALLVTLVVSAALTVVAGPAYAADTVHTGPNWSWTGPDSWTASYGTYGITVFGDKGSTIDLGFSSTRCASGATWNDSVTNYFKDKRKQLKGSGLTLKSVGRIKSLDAMYRRQTITWTAKRNGAKYKGVAVLDYDFTTSTGDVDYCFQQSESRSSLKSAWSSRSSKLATVRKSFAYSGPGAPQTPDA